MKTVYKTLAKTALVCAALFGASVVIYLYNLDLRFIAWLQPRLEWIYDRIERRPMP